MAGLVAAQDKENVIGAILITAVPMTCTTPAVRSLVCGIVAEQEV